MGFDRRGGPVEPFTLLEVSCHSYPEDDHALHLSCFRDRIGGGCHHCAEGVGAIHQGYAISFYLLTLVLRSLPVGITYAIWAGMGIFLVAVIGAVYYKEIPDLPAVVGMVLIIAGVVVLQGFSKTPAA